ncbi:triacylglycerol lipase [Antrihabitans sp. YC2-6]|uniref:esterase/lipase family protein n=1 Tax=Antrihabitans sp. YC2-6 TaxID=2799498 RepID=UPI0018F47679|nr:alpha/beta fold hydrolase [Antrihabitans sp. YC2-6]MBJ8347534.1 alpha/beta fold hydrolase [Antrihabitans sp. YC2-6]
MRTARVTAAAGMAAILMLGAGSQAANADDSDEPVPGYNLMGPPPPGVNDWNCKPSAAHPRPVVLVHGTGSSMQSAFSLLGPQLAEAGYCAFAPNYGGLPPWWDAAQVVWGVADIRESAAQLATFVDAVLAHTGASQVDIVGHSQGGTMSRQYLKFNGGADAGDPARNKVRSLIALGPTNHGTTFNGMQQLFRFFIQMGMPADLTSRVVFGIAGRQQLVGSKLISDLNSTGETLPGVDYTVIATKFDEVVTPPQNAFLSPDGPGEVHNVWVQDGCETNRVPHENLLGDDRSRYLVMVSLDPAYADAHPAPC